MSSLWRNQLMFTQRTAVIQQGSAATQLMFHHTQRSAAITLETDLQSSQLSQPPLGQLLLFLDTLLKNILHYTRRTPVAPGYAATLRHSIGSSSPQYSPSCLEARYFYLWRVHSIGHFHNSSRCCLKENQLHHLDAPFPNMLFLLQTPSHSMDRQRWADFTQITASQGTIIKRCGWTFHLIKKIYQYFYINILTFMYF